MTRKHICRIPYGSQSRVTLRRILVGSIFTAALAVGGCSLYPEDMRSSVDMASVPHLDLQSGPITRGEHGLVIRSRPLVDAPDVVTIKYDPLHWALAKQVYFRAFGEHNDEWVFIDTGLNHVRVTADVVKKRRLPSASDIANPVAFVDELQIDKQMRITQFPALIEYTRWQVRVFGILPIYRQTGWALGTDFLTAFNYVAFDNKHREVTFGCRKASFDAPQPEGWDRYALKIENGLPVVVLPVAGVPMKVVADSGGGPAFVVDAADWPDLSQRLRVLSHRKDKTPSWTGFLDTDVYEVADLQVGSIKKGHSSVWVRDQGGLPALAGLSIFENTVIVLDFQHSLLWVKH